MNKTFIISDQNLNENLINIIIKNKFSIKDFINTVNKINLISEL